MNVRVGGGDSGRSVKRVTGRRKVSERFEEGTGAWRVRRIGKSSSN